jgi:hypothetical protein
MLRANATVQLIWRMRIIAKRGDRLPSATPAVTTCDHLCPEQDFTIRLWMLYHPAR